MCSSRKLRLISVLVKHALLLNMPTNTPKRTLGQMSFGPTLGPLNNSNMPIGTMLSVDGIKDPRMNLLDVVHGQQSLDQEQHQEAEAHSKEGLTECKKTFGQDHIDILKIITCLNMAYQSQGCGGEALATNIRIPDWCKANYGPSNIDTSARLVTPL
jgi:hypothetical protein